MSYEHVIKNVATGETTVVPFTEAEIIEYNARSIYIPQVVTMRQARLALLQSGYLDIVNTAIANMTGVEGAAAKIEWEYAQTVDIKSPLVTTMTTMLSLTEDQLNSLFILANSL